MKILYVIPARGGSKGIPRKNIRELGGKPLIQYSIDVARSLAPDEDICVSTDDAEIAGVVESFGLKVPFKRPEALANDQASTNDVLLHALSYYESIGRNYDVLVLLQPTSPFRTPAQVKEAIELYEPHLDMVVSVRKSHAASVLCNENQDGYLDMSLNKGAARRQDIPDFYEINGAIYVINVKALKEKGLAGFQKRKKFVMPEEASVDLDTPADWFYAEQLLSYQHSNP